MAREPLPPETLAELCEAYKAGAGMRSLSTTYRRPRNEIRDLLVGAGVEIRKSNRHAARDREVERVAKAEREARVRTVAGWLVDGITNRHEILERANDPEGPYGWGVELSTIDRYIADARALLREQNAEAIEDRRAVARAQFDQLWREAKGTDARLKVLDRRLKFEGSDAPARLEHGGPNGGPIRIISLQELSDEELDALANGL